MAQRVNAIVQGHAVLSHLATQQTAQGVVAIANDVGLSPSSCFNVLKTLVDLDLASFDTKTKTYELGAKIFELARAGTVNNPIQTKMQPVLRILAERHNATACLWEIVEERRAVLIGSCEKSSGTSLKLEMGHRQPIAAGSVGRAVMSTWYKDNTKIRRFFDEVKWEGDLSFDAYLADLKAAAKKGYAIDQDKMGLGVTTVSAAFTRDITRKRHCLTVMVLSGSRNRNAINTIGRDVKNAARRANKSEASND